MSSLIKIQSINRNDIDFLLRGLDDFEKARPVRSGLSAAGKVFKDGGVRRLKKIMKNPHGHTGNLLDSFTVRVKKRKPGVLAGFLPEGRHAHLVDRGTKERTRSKVGGYYKGGKKTTGVMPAKYFWTDTQAADYPAAMDKLYLGIERAVIRIMERKT